MTNYVNETITAIATANGHAGIGVIRISGTLVKDIVIKITGKLPNKKEFKYCSLRDRNNIIIDQGLILVFENPNSFTGEDVAEFQLHGNPFVLNKVVKLICSYGARIAKPGEFTERAYLNGKIDLNQAEAIADFINAQSEKAAKSALSSLQGAFSKSVKLLNNKIIKLRTLCEAHLDFVEDEITPIKQNYLKKEIFTINETLEKIVQQCQQGKILNEGFSIMLVGKPNVGKSSLFNALTCHDHAIITDKPGTTRDLLRNDFYFNGIKIELIDSAGIHNTEDTIEKIGIQKAKDNLNNVDLILCLLEITDLEIKQIMIQTRKFVTSLSTNTEKLIVYTKNDLKEVELKLNDYDHCSISTKTENGLKPLFNKLENILNISNSTEVPFISRQRHINALLACKNNIPNIIGEHNDLALIAEDLRQAHLNLEPILGKFSNEDLLESIFSNFCIGK